MCPCATQTSKFATFADYSFYRFHLVFIKDQINPSSEIQSVISQVKDVYLTADQKPAFIDPDRGIIRQIEKACNNIQHKLDSQKESVYNVNKVDKKLLHDLKAAVELYNSTVADLSKEGPLAKSLASIDRLPFEMITCILEQVYHRTVSPKVDILKKRKEQTENGKDNTYGEIRPLFVSDALAKAGLNSQKVFLDLGSGVGNVVLQAALEFGCESFGCEMIDNACDLAEAQEKEFVARCRLWGLEPGKVELVRGSFFDNQATLAAIKRADVILVNNEVFSPDTNVRLVQMFLDCKEGCKIISLQPFVEPGHEITERNLYNPVNQLNVEMHQYYADYVSWKAENGEYYISTKDRSRLEAYEKGV